MDMKYRVNLPSDIMYELLSYSPIGKMHTILALLSPDIEMNERHEIIDRILNINIYLSQLTEHSEALLHAMRQTDTILSGSRAVNYFVPGSVSETSDWDFYSSSKTEQLRMFVQLTKPIGFVWKEYNRPYNEGGIVKDFLAYVCEITYKGISHKIQLILAHTISVYSCVIRFDLTFCQCIISGFFALSLYHRYTSRQKAIKFEYGTEERTAKYRKRGVHVTEIQNFHAYKKKHKDILSALDTIPITLKDKHTIQSFITINEYRHLLDKETCTIFFDKYTDMSLWHMSKDQICKILPMIRWYNTDYPNTSKEICFLPHIDNIPRFQFCSPTLHSAYDGLISRLLYGNIIGYNQLIRPAALLLFNTSKAQILSLTIKNTARTDASNINEITHDLTQLTV